MFLCWGSFLNVVAYRLVHDISFSTSRSLCPRCRKKLAWYDLIPLLSWLYLKGKCRSCKASISILYPFIELLTAISMTALYYTYSGNVFFSYFMFFSCLIVSIRTDLETMLISRYVTLFAIPVGMIAAALHLLPISLFESVTGALAGYAILWIIATLFKFFTGKDGMGEGDMELLAFIGSVAGPIGVWSALTIGAFSGSLIGIFAILLKKIKHSLYIPFGPFLASGSMIYVFLQKPILKLMATLYLS